MPDQGAEKRVERQKERERKEEEQFTDQLMFALFAACIFVCVVPGLVLLGFGIYDAGGMMIFMGIIFLVIYRVTKLAIARR
jgi:uncharacterized ion transporter superfamily protein YfcC